MNPSLDLNASPKVAPKRKKRKGLDLPKQKYFTLEQKYQRTTPSITVGK